MSSKAKNLSKLSAVLAEGGTLTASTTAPTAALGTSTNQLATTAFVGNALNGLINAAPTTLDTLNELAAALGNDSNFATTVTNTLALKAPLASPALTGTATAVNLTYTGALTGNGGIINIGAGQIYKDASGNVGIGITNPSLFGGKLSVVSAGATQSTLMVQNPGQGTAHLGFAAGGSNVKLYNCYADGLLSSGKGIDIDSNGNVGIGIAAPSYRLSILGTSGRYFDALGSSIQLRLAAAEGGWANAYNFAANNGTVVAGLSAGGSGQTASYIAINLATEIVRIDNSGISITGNTLGLTAPAGVGNAQFAIRASNMANADASLYLEAPGVIGGWVYMSRSSNQIRVSCGSQTNGVSIGNGGSSWGSFSDERMKDIIEPITDAANKVATLRAVIGKYKTDDEGKRRSFLIAQDVQAVLPEAIYGEEHGEGMLSLAYTDVIPLLTAAIQELKAIVDDQAVKIAALEAK